MAHENNSTTPLCLEDETIPILPFPMPTPSSQKEEFSHHCYIFNKSKKTEDCSDILKSIILPYLPMNERITNLIENKTECMFFVQKWLPPNPPKKE